MTTKHKSKRPNLPQALRENTTRSVVKKQSRVAYTKTHDGINWTDYDRKHRPIRTRPIKGSPEEAANKAKERRRKDKEPPEPAEEKGMESPWAHRQDLRS